MQPHPPPPRSGEVNPLALVSLVLGVVSIPLTFCFVLGVPAGLTAIVTGLLGRRTGGAGRGQALAGIVAGAVGLALNALVIALPDS